jgi:hypothetical protein
MGGNISFIAAIGLPCCDAPIRFVDPTWPLPFEDLFVPVVVGAQELRLARGL